MHTIHYTCANPSAARHMSPKSLPRCAGFFLVSGSRLGRLEGFLMYSPMPSTRDVSLAIYMGMGIGMGMSISLDMRRYALTSPWSPVIIFTLTPNLR
ncbi:hypothetical protein EON63_04725 [archaeon]|nr:MAG: hypothetical protein EON63_04725 [archaeon]